MTENSLSRSKTVKVPMSGNAPVSVNTRSKGSTRYPVSIKSTSHSSVPMCGICLEPDCEQLLYRYSCHGEHPRGARSWTLRCKNVAPFDWFHTFPARSPPSLARFVRAKSVLSVPALRKWAKRPATPDAMSLFCDSLGSPSSAPLI